MPPIAFSAPKLVMFPLEERLRICRELSETITHAVEGSRLAATDRSELSAMPREAKRRRSLSFARTI
jgi:hypothetical protein